MDQTLQNKQNFVHLVHNPVTAWVILGTSLCLTFLAWQLSNKYVEKRAIDRFEFRCSEIIEAINDRLRVYEQVLRGGVSLMSTAEQGVDRKTWATYVKNLEIDKHWTGIQGFGYAVPVTPENKHAHEQGIQAEGFERFHIRPKGDRKEYSSIIYLEPFDWRNKRAFGYDMWSNSMRREAMTRARDTGEAATSGIITLVQETQDDIQRGFLTYLPFYEPGKPANTLENRRKHFLGWVYAPYRAKNLMQGILGSNDSGIDFEIFDGKNIHKDSLLYDSNKVAHIDQPDKQYGLEKQVTITNQGRDWTIYFHTPQSFLSSEDKRQSRFVAIGGIIIDLLLFYLLYSFHFIQRRATAIAEQMTKTLKEAQENLEEQVHEKTKDLQKIRTELEQEVHKRTEELEKRMVQLERINTTMVDREIRMKELKSENERLKRKLG